MKLFTLLLALLYPLFPTVSFAGEGTKKALPSQEVKLEVSAKVNYHHGFLKTPQKPTKIKKVDINQCGHTFAPGYIVVKKGTTLELKVSKDGHFISRNIVIEGPASSKKVKGEENLTIKLTKEPRVVSFTPRVAGKYRYYCKKKMPFMQAKNIGMFGTIEVFDPPAFE